MLSPKLRQDIYELWTMFWSSGMTNPLTSIEQITYLLFLKRLETLDAERMQKDKPSIYGPRYKCELPHHPDDATPSSSAQRMEERQEGYCVGHRTCRWSYIVQGQTVPNPATGQKITPHDHLSQYVFPWLRVLDKTLSARKGEQNSANGLASTAKRMEDAYFQFPREKAATLQRSIKFIDALFGRVHVDSSDDVMGDIFEFLLSEIQTSGKNGQFRTPRHIIRFMVELLAPDRNESIADPAAGTAGFLINDIQYVMKRYTPSETIRLEWDGTPHRINGARIPISEPFPNSKLFAGYDNDRTMVRIGWMNLILHGLEDPNIHLKDALSKPREDEQGNLVEDIDAYDVVFANPPFTGTVDKDSLSERLKDLATNKSELLFVLRILDMLKVGGRAAVIVPEGVLFGSTNAHKELRRRLLLDNLLDGVISLPAGVFQPYTGVKTSILLFHKINDRCRAGMEPQTKGVWFYEVAVDGYSLDARRTPRPDQDNDIWDALEKWRQRKAESEADDISTSYYQPDIYPVRWRLIDEATLRIFPELASDSDKVRSIHELFRDLPDDPKQAEAIIVDRGRGRILRLYETALNLCEQELIAHPRSQKLTKDSFDQAIRDLARYFDDAKRNQLERGKDLPEYGRKALDPLLRSIVQNIPENIDARVVRVMNITSKQLAMSNGTDSQKLTEVASELRPDVNRIVREFAKLDGYDVHLRSLNVTKKKPLKESKYWVVPVRAFARREDWISSDGKLQGSHDGQGQLRPQYVADPSIYNQDGTLPKDRLDPDCIEYNDFNLSAGRYKPFSVATVHYDPPAKIIRKLQALEAQIQDGLTTLLAMVEGRE